MTEYFYRVRAEVTYVGEWFVPIDENVVTKQDAIFNVKSGVRFIDPENILSDPIATVRDLRDVWVANEDGERVGE